METLITAAIAVLILMLVFSLITKAIRLAINVAIILVLLFVLMRITGVSLGEAMQPVFAIWDWLRQMFQNAQR
ncbi:hypothetical protein [Thermoleptolyngbya sp. M55_K2018_002]|uniref:hypothetical protein n=1 Tax=Thermoleptolyngbya sp. M55_K2018_002 TaxID=2747808 RepID=UPI0019E975F2|nr:hypothetical protein [Thermoleptolyngbya sp. M55_K2018_002]HIK39231.1 hypothetical protein [Thermoleptolyngbya sp. M55_K2018_002]